MTASATAVYAYCVVRSVRRPAGARTPRGVPGATRPDAAAVARGLWIVTADVPVDVYGPAALEPRLSDLSWVSEVAVGHEAVVEHFARARGATVLPMKLFTMFSSFDKAAAGMRERRSAIESALRRVAGCEEWGIRISRASATARRRTRQPPSAARAAAGPVTGAAFLAARRDARETDRAAHAAQMEAAGQAFDALARLSRDSRLREGRAEPGSNPPLLEGAFLVTAKSRSRFKTAVRRQAAVCAAAGAHVTLTGPWPAYNFVGDPA